MSPSRLHSSPFWLNSHRRCQSLHSLQRGECKTPCLFPFAKGSVFRWAASCIASATQWFEASFRRLFSQGTTQRSSTRFTQIKSDNTLKHTSFHKDLTLQVTFASVASITKSTVCQHEVKVRRRSGNCSAFLFAVPFVLPLVCPCLPLFCCFAPGSG